MTGHDGGEQAERAAQVFALPPQRPRPERVEQPSWLDDWPAAPPGGPPPPRYYDDIPLGPIAGGET